MNKDIIRNYDYPLDSRWDNVTLEYDTKSYPWQEMFLSAIGELKPIDDLTKLHNVFKTEELIGLRKYLERFSRSKEFSKLADKFFEEYVSDKVDGEYLIQATAGIRTVVPNQRHKGRLLNWHTGYWTGYSNDMGTVWIPVTDAYDSNTMKVLSWDDSVELMSKIHGERWQLDRIEEECTRRMRSVDLKYGQCWLFNQGHLHGNVNNETGITRVSFDLRYCTKSGDFGPRRPGSFFRLIGTSQENNNTDTGPWVVFVDQNSNYIGDTPHFMIREFLIASANQMKLNVVEWSNEYWGCTWMPKLQEIIQNKNVKGIMFPSIHAFSCTTSEAIELFEMSVNNGKQLFFADESLLVTTQNDIDLIDNLYKL
jgi:sporadic carbohydrate cluster 2OG-Fe(II) oxygenase